MSEERTRTIEPSFSPAALRQAGAPRKLVRAGARIDLSRARILDVGCGDGVYLRHFAGGSVGVDRSEERVASLCARGLEAVVRDVETPAWTRGLDRFDVVWLCDILVHLRDPESFLRTLPAVLAGTGRLWITEWLWPARRAAAGAVSFVVPGGRATWTNPEHRHHLTRASMRALLAGTGFAVEFELNHTFESALLARLVEPFWPPRTIVARARA